MSMGTGHHISCRHYFRNRRIILKKRIPELDFIKGIAIFLVVTGHVISQVWNTSPEIYENSILFRFCYSFHMPLFVFISGYICRMTIKNTGQWLLKRLRRIGIPYLLMTAIVSIWLRNGDISQFIVSAPYWYLLFVMISDSILFLGIKLGYGTVIFAPVYAAVLLLTQNIPHNIGILRQLADFLPFYAAGALIPVLINKIKRFKLSTLIGSGFYITVFPFYRHGIGNQLAYCRELLGTENLSRIVAVCIIVLNKIAVPISGIAMVFLLTKFVYSLKSARKLRSAMETAGNHTLAVYLLHDLFFVKPFASPIANAIISLFTAFFIPLTISVMYRSVKKKLGNNL